MLLLLPENIMLSSITNCTSEFEIANIILMISQGQCISKFQIKTELQNGGYEGHFAILKLNKYSLSRFTNSCLQIDPFFVLILKICLNLYELICCMIKPYKHRHDNKKEDILLIFCVFSFLIQPFKGKKMSINVS